MPKARTSDGAELHYEVAGEGEPLILAAGLGGSASFWTEQIPRFARSYRVISYDLRGAGRSTPWRGTYSIEQMAEDALIVLDAAGIERAHFVGHSTGGCIGQVLAIENPDRLLSLVASSSWASADPYFRRLFETRRRILLDAGPAAYVRSGSLFQYPPEWIAVNGRRLDAEEAAAIRAFPDAAIVASKIEAILSFDRTLDLPKICLPVVVHAAADDMICPPYMSRRLADRIPAARWAMIDGGHFAPRAKPQRYFESVAGQLESIRHETANHRSPKPGTREDSNVQRV